MRAPLALLLLTSALPALAQTGPSFDCAKASSAVEKAICADAKLGALDRRIAAAYAEALKRLDPKATKALRDDQRSFQATLAYGLEWDEGKPQDKRVFDLADTMKDRAEFLGAIDAAPAGRWAGTWSNHFGGIDIETKGDGFSVSANGAKPVTGNWVCQIEGTAKVEGDRLVLAGSEDGKPDGWTYALTRDGDRIVFSQAGPKGERHGSPTCGHNGSMEGDYFFLAKPVPEGGGAIAPQRNR